MSWINAWACGSARMMLCPDDVQVSAVIALMLLYFTDIFVEVFVSAPGERNHGHLTLQI